MNTINHNNCDGCAAYLSTIDPHDISCTHPRQNDKSECPCTICVIKVVCGDPCEDYLKFRKIAIARKRRGK